MLLLLDKGVVRRCAEGLGRLAKGKALTAEQRRALLLVEWAPEGTLFTSVETLNLLSRFEGGRILQIGAGLRPMLPMKYQRRWARRLRRAFGFGREDAHQLALATFGTDEDGLVFGVDVFVTYDRRLLRRFEAHFGEMERKLRRMTCQLPWPYREAILPEATMPGRMLLEGLLRARPSDRDP